MVKSDPGKDRKILKAITIAGPRNYSQLAKILDESPETIRYKVKKQIPARGLLIYAILDLSKIGLRPYYVDLRFTPGWRSAAGILLQTLHEHSYLVYHTGYLTESSISVHFTIPYGAENALIELLDEMIDLEILEDYVAKPGKWVNYMSVQAEYFDLSTGEWDVDWSKLKPLESLNDPIRYDGSTSGSQVDRYDLLIFKELQLNSQTSIREMARKLGVNEKTLAYHFNKHLNRLGIIRGYGIKWWGGEYARTNTLTFAEIVARNVKGRNVNDYRRVFEALPFTASSRMLGNNEILVAQAALPNHLLNRALEFLATNLIGMGLYDDVHFRFINASAKESMSYTIPVSMFDAKGRRWLIRTVELKEKLKIAHKMVMETLQKEG